MIHKSGLVPEVEAFLRTWARSLTQLEVLLLLAGEAGRAWRADEVSAALRIAQATALETLRSYAERGLLAEEADSFRYAPRDESVKMALPLVAEACRTHRTRVIEYIYRPSEPAALDAARRLAEAFRIRPKVSGKGSDERGGGES